MQPVERIIEAPPVVRPAETIVSDGALLTHAKSFMSAVDAFMYSQHSTIDYGHRRGVRLDRYQEGDDMVYSIIHSAYRVEKYSNCRTYQSTSLISGGDGIIYGNRHWYNEFDPEDENGEIRIMAGVDHPLRQVEWTKQIVPITKALVSGQYLLKVVS